MSARHTPGPWRFNEATQTVVSNQSHPIATLSAPFHRQCSGGQTGLDGPLIAAAPELLAALQDARERMMGSSPAIRALIAKSDAAIAKALGAAA